MVDDQESKVADLTPELRQVVVFFRERGRADIRDLTNELSIPKREANDRVFELRQLGLLEMIGAGVCTITSAGRKADIRNPPEIPIENPFHQAGFTERQIARDEAKLAAEERREERQRVKIFNGEADGRENFETKVRPDALPEDFVDRAVEQCRLEIRFGNFEALHGIARKLKAEWESRQAERSPLASLPLGQRLAVHLSECRDRGQRINPRIINSVEEICSATLGAIKENWPLEFARVPNIGIESIKLIGRVLLSADLLAAGEFEKGLESCVAIIIKTKGKPSARRIEDFVNSRPQYADLSAEF